jgi:hypothetical protein
MQIKPAVSYQKSSMENPSKTVPLLHTAILDVGAYCGAMASNYNMRGRALEIGKKQKELSCQSRRANFVQKN